MKLDADLVRGFTGNTRVDLVEDQGLRMLLIGKCATESQHHTGKLTARCDLGERLQRLAGVGGNGERHFIHTVWGKLTEIRDLDAEAYLFHIEKNKLACDLFLQIFCRGAAFLGNLQSDLFHFLTDFE